MNFISLEKSWLTEVDVDKLKQLRTVFMWISKTE